MGQADSAEQIGQTSALPFWAGSIPRLTAFLVLTAAVIVVIFARHEMLPAWQLVMLAAIAFCCEFVDSGLGMGYGTIFTPLLLLTGLELTTVVPVILLSEFFTGLTAGSVHHAFGNARFKWKSRDTNVALVLGIAGIFGALFAVQFLTMVPRLWARLYFSLMITAMGVIVLLGRNSSYRFSWLKIGGLGLISSFNKGMSGGGYGPLVVGGQVLSGCEAKHAVGCTSLAESLVCLVALIGFAASGVFPGVALAVPIVLGAVLSAPCAAAMTRYLDSRVDLKRVVGSVVLALGILCLFKVVRG